jgi:predicted transcriptional regulator
MILNALITKCRIQRTEFMYGVNVEKKATSSYICKLSE